MEVVKEHLKRIEKPYKLLMDKGSAKFFKLLIQDKFGAFLLTKFLNSEEYPKTLKALKGDEANTWTALY